MFAAYPEFTHPEAINRAFDLFTHSFIDRNSSKIASVFNELDSVDAVASLDFNTELAVYATFLDFKDFVADDTFIRAVLRVTDEVSDNVEADADDLLDDARMKIDALLDIKLHDFIMMPRGLVESVELDALLESPYVMFEAMDVLRDELLSAAIDTMNMNIAFQAHVASIQREFGTMNDLEALPFLGE